VIAKSYARIHRKNLINFGILPPQFINEADHGKIDQEDILSVENIHEQVKAGAPIKVENKTKGITIETENALSEKEREEVLAGGFINVFLAKHSI